MSRVSRDEIKAGFVWNGYDYNLQVWVRDGVVQRCGHGFSALHDPPCNCKSKEYVGRAIETIPQAERRW